jgi:hypothetical protein
MMAPFDARARSKRALGRREHVVPSPVTPGMGILLCQGIGEVDVPKALCQVALMEIVDGL